MTDGDLLTERLSRIPPNRRGEFLRRLGLEGAEPGQLSATRPLTDEQQQVWVAARMLAPASPTWTTSRYRIRGPLQSDLLTSAIRDVYLTTDLLHAVFRESDGTVGEAYSPDENFAIRVADVSAVPPAERDNFLTRSIAELTRELPSVERGPLVRALLIAVGPQEHVLVWAAHPLVFDGRSAHVLVDVLARAYSAIAAGKPVPAAAPYDDYRRWRRIWQGSVEADEHLEGWRHALEGAQLTELPYDQQPEHAALKLAQVCRPLEAATLEAVEASARQLGVTAEAIVSAAFAVMLSRHTSQTDLVIGCPTDITVPSLDQTMLGVFGNLLPLRFDLSGRPSFEDFAHRSQRVIDDARARALIPFQLLINTLPAPRDPGNVPLVTTAISLSRPVHPVEAAGVIFALEQPPPSGWRFRLGVEVSLAEPDRGLRASFDESCLREQNVARLLDRFALVLADGCADPSRRVNSLRLVPESERERTLHEWNDAAAPRGNASVLDLMASAIREHAERTAIVARDKAMTYAQLGSASRRVARRLIALGIGPEDRVGLAVSRDTNAIVVVLGILNAGAAFVPVDCDQPATRVRTILDDAGASLVVTDEVRVSRIPSGPWKTVAVESLLGQGGDVESPPPNPGAPIGNAAYVMYTSGSTGKPKGVLIEHRSVANFAQTVKEMFDLTPADRILHFAATTFDVSIFEIFAALTTGAELHIASEDERRSLDGLTRILADHEITVCDLPPAIMDLLDPTRFPHLRIAFVGGEAFTGELTTRWARECRFFNGYGPTETTVTVVAKECAGEWSTSPPIGRAMANHRAYVLNDEYELQPIGVAGELFIAGKGLARGYIGRPDATAAAFVPDLFAPDAGERMYKTGDLAYWNIEGDLVFVGRNDRQIKLRGIRIELGEVEAAIERHPQVRQAAVVPVARADGAQDAALIAYVVSRVGTPIDGAAMREFLLGQLPEFMLPARVVHVERLPLTASGKLDVAALPSPQAEGGPAAPDVLPRTPTEQRVATEVFGPLLELEAIDVNANLFALGGSSLQAIQVLAKVRSVFGVDVAIGDFFRSPTVAHVAAEIDRIASARQSIRATVSVSLVLEDKDDAVFDAFVDGLRRSLSRKRIKLDLEAGQVVEARDGLGEGNIARVRDWLPGRRALLEWHPADWAGNEPTELELRADVTDAGTRVTIEHRGWGAPIGDGWGPVAAHDAANRSVAVIELAEWFASELATPVLQAMAPTHLGDWLTDRWVGRPTGSRQRAAYADAGWEIPHFRLVLDVLGLTSDDRLLEVGCGGGAFLSEALVSGCRAAAIDRSDEMAQIARERNHACVEEGWIEIMQADAHKLPFAEGTFTKAAMIGVLPFIAEPVAALREIRRVLRPGGQLVVFTSAPELRGTIAVPEPMASRLRLYADDELGRLADAAGFADVSVSRPEDRERHARAAGVPAEYLPLYKGRGAQLVLATC